MADALDNIVLTLLREIRAEQARTNTRLDRFDERLANVESAVGHMMATLGQVNLRLLALERRERQVDERLEVIGQHGKTVSERLEAIERHLGLAPVT